MACELGAMSNAPRILAALLLVTVALVAAKAAYAWSAVKYVDAQSMIGDGILYTSGVAYREFNRVWRPASDRFCLHISGMSEVCNTGQNPFTDGRNGTGFAACANDNAHASYPVTCLTTRP
jgi:hypothetical protein